MRVRATYKGFYGRIYEPGQEFELHDEALLGSWMEPVDPKDRERLAERIAAFKKVHRNRIDPTAPITTGPGLRKEAVMPLPGKSSKADDDFGLGPAKPSKGAK